ncbi:MAG: hypothetical protein K2J47_06665 [Ruminococcus sp.]|nr:hypothetical protein [Ruminococcus sp.]MDE6788987.1 hypothetical protein [Ruminococcus sp.]
MLTEKAEDFVKSKLLEYRSELETVLNGGDISQYNYCECAGEIGTYDINSINRLRISLALWYMSDGLDVESLAVALMNEEIKDLENAVYGGTSKTIYLLSYKILGYKKCSYRKLLKRAKKANFDCFFEIDVYYLKKFAVRFRDWHNEDWEYIFEILDDKESLETLKRLNQEKE